MCLSCSSVLKRCIRGAAFKAELCAAGIVLKLFVFLLPFLLWWMNVKQGMVAASLVDAGVIQKFFIFQVCCVRSLRCLLARAVLGHCSSPPGSILRHSPDHCRKANAACMPQRLCQPLASCTPEHSVSAQVLTVFLGSFLAGSLFSQFNAWIDNPSSAVTILGTAAPLTSIFFLNYISLGVCSLLALLLRQVGANCMPSLKKA